MIPSKSKQVGRGRGQWAKLESSCDAGSKIKEANTPRVNLNGCISWPNRRIELKIEPHIPWSLAHYVLHFFLLFWSYFSHKKLKPIELLWWPYSLLEWGIWLMEFCVLNDIENDNIWKNGKCIEKQK